MQGTGASSPPTTHQSCIPNKPSIHTGCADAVYIGQHVGFMAIIIDEEVVDDCEAANYVSCTALASAEARAVQAYCTRT